MRFIREIFQDGDQRYSATRFAFLLWLTGTFAIWCFASFHQGALLGIDPSILTLIGILMTGKVAQSVSENATPPAVAPPSRAAVLEEAATNPAKLPVATAS